MTNAVAMMAGGAAIWAAAALHPARAADPAAVQAPIQGATAMGDKGRSGPDGFAWAPVTRDQAPAGKAPGETAASVAAAPNAQQAPGGGKTLPPGQDPGTPATTQAAGPGTIDSPAASHKP